MTSNYYKKGKLLEISDIQRLSEEKKHVYVQTRCDLTIYPAFQLLNWQLQSLLRVKLYEAIYTGDIVLCDTHHPTSKIQIMTHEELSQTFDTCNCQK